MIPPKNSSRLLSGVITGALVTSALAFTAPVVHAAPAPSGAKVLLFNDPAFVDTAPLAEVDRENEGHEGANMILALRAKGHAVSELTGTNAASIAAALKGKNTFVIPELERGEWVPALDAAGKSAIVGWVRGGGTLVVACDYEDTLNALFGYSIEERGRGPWSNAAPKGSPFAGAVASLPDNDGSDSFAVESLPKGAVAQYVSVQEEGEELRASASDAPLLNTGVFTVPAGKGTVVSLGWDWFDAAPVGLQDGGWNNILDRSVRIKPALPSNTFALPAKSKVKVNSKNATATLSLKLPGAGRVKVASARKGVLKSSSKSVGASGKVTVKLKPSKKTLKKLRKQLKTKKVASTKVKVKVTYTPTGGKARTVTKTYVLKLKKARKKK